jgi:DNA-directed RNA polymerase specialized sigma24 family protein
MNQRKDAQTRLWIRNRDSLGQMVDRGLIEAAHRVWERARLVVIRYLAEDTEAPEILEAAVDSASCAMGNHQPIQFFEAYLLRSVAREAIRRLRRNQRSPTSKMPTSSGSPAAYPPLTWIADSMTPGESKFFVPVWMSTDGRCTTCAFWSMTGDRSPS